MNRKNVDIITKMVVIGVGSLAVVLVLALIYVALNKPGADKENAYSSTTKLTTKKEKGEDSNLTFERTKAVVKYADMESRTMVAYDIINSKRLSFNVELSCELKDAYGTAIALSQFEIGDMIEVKYAKETLSPEYIKITATGWEREVTEIEVDEEKKIIKVKNDVYKYTDELVTIENGNPFELSSISGSDEVVLKGYNDIVWVVQVGSRHGSIKLANYSLFIGGTIEIPGKISKDIVANMIISIPAGDYNVSVTKEGIPPFVKRLTVLENEETILDLSEVQAKVGEVEFVSDQEGIQVFVDDKEVNIYDENIFDFGKYKVLAKAEGFKDWEGELLVNQAFVRYKIDFDKEQNFIHFEAPAGAEVYLDGVLVGIIPTKAPFVEGSHKIQLRQEGYRTSETFSYLWEDDGKDKYLSFPDMTPLITTTTTSETTTTESTTQPETTTTQSTSEEETTGESETTAPTETSSESETSAEGG